MIRRKTTKTAQVPMRTVMSRKTKIVARLDAGLVVVDAVAAVVAAHAVMKIALMKIMTIQ